MSSRALFLSRNITNSHRNSQLHTWLLSGCIRQKVTCLDVTSRVTVLIAQLGGVPTGDDQFNAVAFAVQQPFPNLIWRADLSMLYDLEGGILVQPGVRWRPRDDFQLDLYANVIDSDGGNDDIMGTLETHG